MEEKKINFDKFPEYTLLKDNFPDEVEKAEYALGELSITVKKGKIFDICKFLHDNKEMQYDFLTDVTGVDWAPKDPNEPRFMVVYHLFSMSRKTRLRIKTHLHIEDLEIASVEPIWKTADWQEREAFDMFGIKFIGHPFLRRIYMPDDWDGHPLRKDYPLQGKEGQ